MPDTWNAELLLDARAELGEGPCWDEARGGLWWIDIKSCKVHFYTPSSGENRSYDVGERVGTVVLRENGGLLVALENGMSTLDPDTGAVDPFLELETDLPGNRFNDGKCDPAGRFWVGSMEIAEENMDRGFLYAIGGDKSVDKKFGGIGVSNGITWTSDRKTMYYIDSPTRQVDAFDYDDATGAISNRRCAVALPEGMGYPDGMAIDAEDKLWVALWAGSGVARFDPTNGELLGKIEVPGVSNVTACAFVGPNFDELFITTARHNLEEDQLKAQTHAGSLFHAKVGVPGAKFYPFAG
ncbi:MAG: SMP-30/gluconolactonase/LRE family protein [Planctomycetota bacterium]